MGAKETIVTSLTRNVGMNKQKLDAITDKVLSYNPRKEDKGALEVIAGAGRPASSYRRYRDTVLRS